MRSQGSACRKICLRKYANKIILFLLMSFLLKGGKETNGNMSCIKLGKRGHTIFCLWRIYLHRWKK